MCLAVFGVVLLGSCAVFAFKRIYSKKSNPSPRVDSRFWLDVALYGGGFLLMFYFFFGKALAIYLGYGDLT